MPTLVFHIKKLLFFLSDCSFYFFMHSVLISRRQHFILFLWIFIFFLNNISSVSFKFLLLDVSL